MVVLFKTLIVLLKTIFLLKYFNCYDGSYSARIILRFSSAWRNENLLRTIILKDKSGSVPPFPSRWLARLAFTGTARREGSRRCWLQYRGSVLPSLREKSRTTQGVEIMPRVYIGRLSYHVREKDIQRFFSGYGKLMEIDLKNGWVFFRHANSVWRLTFRSSNPGTNMFHVPLY